MSLGVAYQSALLFLTCKVQGDAVVYEPNNPF
jgi:hypothetical protein